MLCTCFKSRPGRYREIPEILEIVQKCPAINSVLTFLSKCPQIFSERGLTSVTFVRPTQGIKIFGNVFTPFGMLDIH